MPISAFLDADWAGNVDYRRSTGGYAIFFVVISLPGVQENKLRSPDRVRKPNTRPLLMLLPRLSGFKSCFVNLGFLCPCLQVSGATTVVRRTSPPIPFSIGV
jgi:hypothetical protein